MSLLAASAQRTALPPIVWTCPMHPDVIEDHAGQCPICNMKLEQARLDYTWSCPVHSVIDQDHEGKCPICRRDLVRVTVNLSFTCADRPSVHQLNPGKCADGSSMIPMHTVRAHGNHNPQHGGMFFMASDNWHHLEGTYPENGLFRLYVYDDYSKPLPIDQMKQVRASVVKGSLTIPLKLAPDGLSLEGRVDGLKTPAQLAADVKFKPNDASSYHFDFSFQELTKVDSGAPTIVVPGPMQPIDIPAKTGDVISLLLDRNDEIRDLIQKGSFAEIYVPAFQAKDLALALELRAEELPLQRRSSVPAAVEKIVRSAWQLDAFGDQGDASAINGTYATFDAAVRQLETVFGARRP